MMHFLQSAKQQQTRRIEMKLWKYNSYNMSIDLFETTKFNSNEKFDRIINITRVYEPKTIYRILDCFILQIQLTSAKNILDFVFVKTKQTPASMDSESNKEIESFVLRSVIGSDNNNKDIYDLIDQIHSLTISIDNFKTEIIDDLTECVGMFIDRFAMDKFEQKNQNKN